MNKFGFVASIATIVAALGIAAFTSKDAEADGTACVHKDFKTELVKQACAKGGQAEAKDAMKAFMKDKKIKSCNQCHDKLAPSYSLKPDGLEQYTKAGGK